MRKVWRGYHNNLESIVESFEIIQEYKVEATIVALCTCQVK